ncbi:hypothetical protein HMPREF9567_02434 [Cutibacterium acnes HL013PA1]|nr:hypothetical protein HMPREF9567_02434 [Cutibacterium acnes HL013PA1]
MCRRSGHKTVTPSWRNRHLNGQTGPKKREHIASTLGGASNS